MDTHGRSALKGLRWMLQQKDPKDQLAHWIQRLSPYQFIIEHRAGKKHGNADAMSRKCFRGGVCHHPNGPDMEQVPEGTTWKSEELRDELPAQSTGERPTGVMYRVNELLHEGPSQVSCHSMNRPVKQQGFVQAAASQLDRSWNSDLHLQHQNHTP